MPNANHWLTMITALGLLTMIGCGTPPDGRIEEFARESLKRQAQQNEQMASQSRETAEAARELVKSDGVARQESLQLQQAMIERDATARTELNRLQQDAHTAMQQERAAVDRQKSELDTERRQFREQAGRDPIIAAAISAIGLLLVCLLPLALAAYAMYVITRNSDDDRIVSELLITDLASDEPRLLPTVRFPPSLGHSPSDRLPGLTATEGPVAD